MLRKRTSERAVGRQVGEHAALDVLEIGRHQGIASATYVYRTELQLRISFGKVKKMRCILNDNYQLRQPLNQRGLAVGVCD